MASLAKIMNFRIGSEVRAQRPSEPGLECADKPTLRLGSRFAAWSPKQT
jgi:hypothetical protein